MSERSWAMGRSARRGRNESQTPNPLFLTSQNPAISIVTPYPNSEANAAPAIPIRGNRRNKATIVTPADASRAMVPSPG
jgi:hypothetical protein